METLRLLATLPLDGAETATVGVITLTVNDLEVLSEA
jgi:hypothetical protein